ncbi:MAG: hypothetical protein A2104_07140 [Candidatus Melainabacteria bacterium GWF2_32_7]|nr:MAG: hypothetical protein A2104_07140 [Candidatus Melainabacteria bacterium GWF2_32_7]
MSINRLVRSILIINLLASGVISQTAISSPIMPTNDDSLAQTYSSGINEINTQLAYNEIPNSAADYSQRGINYYKSNEYTKAISEFEQALKLNPQDSSTRVNLAAAHIARGSYFFRLDLAKSANDYRRAIYYLKYDENIPEKQLTEENLSTAITNLKNVLTEYKVNLSPKNRLKMAKELRGQGNFKEAVVEFQEALTDSNSKLEVYEALGDIMRVLQKNNKAIEYYQNALLIDTNQADLHTKLAIALNKAGNLDIAVKEYNIALSLDENNKEIINSLENIWKTRLQEDPQDPVAHMNLGVVLQKKGDFQNALNEYKIAESIDPKNLTLSLNLGTLFQAMNDLPMALRAYDSILQINPTDPLAHYYRATALKQIGNIKGAIDEFQIVLKIDPNNIPAKKSLFEAVKEIQNPDESLQIMSELAKAYENDAIAQYNFAYQLHSQKKIDEALAFYQKTIVINPKLIDAYLNIASIYKEKQQYSEAILTLQNALVVNPDDSKVKSLLAQIQESATISKYDQAVKKHNQGDYEGAIQDYLRIAEENGDSADVYVSLGAAYQAANKINEAAVAYNKALELDKENSAALYYLGTIYYSQKNYEKAYIVYEKALTQDPDNGDIKEALKSVKLARDEELLNKGLNEYNAQKYLKALEIFNLVIKSDLNNAYAYYYRGMVYDAQKKYLTAIEDYKKALAKDNTLILAYYALGVDYDTLNLKVDAKKAYQKFVDGSKDQNDEYVKYAKQRLQKL